MIHLDISSQITENTPLMENRSIWRLLALLVAFSVTIQPALAFTDVPASSHYAKAITYLQNKNVVKGFPDGTARPHAHLSRVEGLVSILRMQERYAPQVVWFTANLPDMALFEDADQSAWYAPYVEVGFLEGVITGNGNGKMNPSSPLTTEQALIMLKRSFKSDDQISFKTSTNLTNIPNAWFTDAISWAIDRNLISPNDQLALGSPITRGKFFSILHRLHSIESEGQYAYVDDPSQIAANQQPATINQQLFPDIVSVPLNITPVPFDPNDPFILNLPPPTTTFGPVAKPVIQHQYASNKQFAITIPSLNLMDVAIIHPDDPFSKEGILAPLKVGLGHLFAYPGNTGKMMVYGHSSSYPWDISDYTRIFRQINKMVVGERVYITHEGKLHVYEVTRKQVIDAKDVSPFNDDGMGEELILYTCWPPDSIKQRYLVHASPVEVVALR